MCSVIMARLLKRKRFLDGKQLPDDVRSEDEIDFPSTTSYESMSLLIYLYDTGCLFQFCLKALVPASCSVSVSPLLVMECSFCCLFEGYGVPSANPGGRRFTRPHVVCLIGA